MIKIIGPFPFFLYRIAPSVVFASGVVIGANSTATAEWLIGSVPLYCAAAFGLVGFWLCNGMIDTMKGDAE